MCTCIYDVVYLYVGSRIYNYRVPTGYLCAHLVYRYIAGDGYTGFTGAGTADEVPQVDENHPFWDHVYPRLLAKGHEMQASMQCTASLWLVKASKSS